MKPLTDEQKDKAFDDIVKSIAHLYTLAPGEFTIKMLLESVHELNPKISHNKIRHRIRTLVDAEILDFRIISTSGTRTKVYFPVKENSQEEILEILLDAS